MLGRLDSNQDLHSFPTRRSSDLLIFRAEGLQVATVTAQNQVALKPVVIGRDYGMEVEIVRGIDAGDQVDRKSTRLNSSHSQISYAVLCLKKKTVRVTLYHSDWRR